MNCSNNRVNYILFQLERIIIFFVVDASKELSCSVDGKAKSHAMKLLGVPEVRANPTVQPCLITACISRGATNCARSLLGSFHSFPSLPHPPSISFAFSARFPLYFREHGSARKTIGPRLGSFVTAATEGEINLSRAFKFSHPSP